MRSLSTIPLLAGLVAAQVTDIGASPQQLGNTTSCPQVMVLAARETTAPPGFGSTMTLVNLIMQAFPGVSAAQSIEYPAAGGNNTRMSILAGHLGRRRVLSAYTVLGLRLELLVTDFTVLLQSTRKVSRREYRPCSHSSRFSRRSVRRV